MHVRLVANAFSDRSSVLNRVRLYFNVRPTNRFYNAAFPTKLFVSLHTTLFKTHVMSKSGDNIGLMWSKIYMSKKCQFVLLHHMPRSSLSCLLAFYGIPIFHTFLIRRIFYLLVWSFHSGMVFSFGHGIFIRVWCVGIFSFFNFVGWIVLRQRTKNILKDFLGLFNALLIMTSGPIHFYGRGH